MRKILFLCLLCVLLLLTSCDLLPNFPLPDTQTPTLTPTLIFQPTQTPQPTATLPEFPPLEPTPDDNFISDPPYSEVKYILQDGGPFYLPNFTHPEQGCAWMGVAGQVFDHDVVEVFSLTIVAGHRFHGEESHLTAITGHFNAYGPGGYEIQLADSPIESSQSFFVQVLDSHNQPLSERIYFDTYADCEQNLILVNLVTVEK